MLFVPPSMPFMVPEAEADHVSYTALNFISPSDWATSCEANNNDCRMSPIDQADSIVFDIHYKPRVPIPFPIESFDIWIDSDNFSSRWVHENWEYQEHTADPTVPLDYSNPTCVSGNTQFGFRGTTPYWSPSTSDPYEISSCGGISVQMINHDVYRFTISGLTDGEHEVIVKSNKLNTWGPATTSFMLKVGDDDTTPPTFTAGSDSFGNNMTLNVGFTSNIIQYNTTNSTGNNITFYLSVADNSVTSGVALSSALSDSVTCDVHWVSGPHEQVDVWMASGGITPTGANVHFTVTFPKYDEWHAPIECRVTDAAGNVSVQGIFVDMIYTPSADTTPPTFTSLQHCLHQYATMFGCSGEEYNGDLPISASTTNPILQYNTTNSTGEDITFWMRVADNEANDWDGTVALSNSVTCVRMDTMTNLPVLQQNYSTGLVRFTELFLGLAPVSCEVTDAAGNVGILGFTVDVTYNAPSADADTTPPTFTSFTEGSNDIDVSDYAASGAEALPISASITNPSLQYNTTNSTGESITFWMRVADNEADTSAEKIALRNSVTCLKQDFVANENWPMDVIPITSDDVRFTELFLGLASVVCNVTDAAGNVGVLGFTVDVVLEGSADTTPPSQNYTVYVNQMRGSGVIDANDPGGCAGLTPQTCYSLSAITINVGDSVTWINKDTTNNWYTLMGSWGGLAPPGSDNACDGPGKLNWDMCGVSGNDRTSWTHTFDQVGTYNYHDWVYQNSAQRPEGVVNVVASGAPSNSTQAPVITTQTSGGGDTTSLDCSNYCTFGSQGSNNNQFNYPFGLALDNSGNIYVADESNNRIQKFDSSGNYLMTITGNFPEPKGVTVDNNGNIYVADESAGSVQQFSSTGTAGWTTTFQAGSNPQDVAVDNSGNVYIAHSNTVDRHDHGSGDGNFYGFSTHCSFWGDPAYWVLENIQFPDCNLSETKGVAVDSSGNVYVANEGNVIQKFGPSGNLILSIGSFDIIGGHQIWNQGTGNGEFDRPMRIAVDNSGNIYVTDFNNDRVQKFDSSGNHILSFGTEGSGAGQFNGPIGIEVDSSGKIYVAEAYNHRVQIFSPSYVNSLPSLSTSSADTTPPVVNVPDGITFPATSNSDIPYPGGHAEIPLPEFIDQNNFPIWAVDDVDGNVDVICTEPNTNFNHLASEMQPWKEPWPVGTNIVTCTATDAAGNVGTASFTITVVLEGVADFSPTFTSFTEGSPYLGAEALPISASITNPSLQYDTTNSTGESIAFWMRVADNEADTSAEKVALRNSVTCLKQDFVANENWPMDVIPLDTGQYDVRFTELFLGLASVVCNVTDSAGNVDVLGFTVDVTYTPSAAEAAAAAEAAVAAAAAEAAAAVEAAAAAEAEAAAAVAAAEAAAAAAAAEAAADIDTTPPILVVSNAMTQQTYDPAGKIVYFASPSATDIGGIAGLSCNYPSGTFFLVGITTVTCTAVDPSGNVTVKSFTITIIYDVTPDTTLPVFVHVSDVVKYTDADGVAYNYAPPQVSDNIGVTIGPTCNPEPGSTFPIGITHVVCTASDAAGNVGTTSFSVTVVNPNATGDIPTFEPVENITEEANVPNGKQLMFSIPTATDDETELPLVFCTPSPGYLFPVGDTIVTCVAIDEDGNNGAVTFTVTITPQTQQQASNETADLSITTVESVTLAGDSVSSVSAGGLAYFTTSLVTNSTGNAFITVYVQDADSTALGVGHFKSVIVVGDSDLTLGFRMPSDAISGIANVYVNVWADETMTVPITDEVDANVEIIGIDPEDVSIFNYWFEGLPDVYLSPPGFSAANVVEGATSYWTGSPAVDTFIPWSGFDSYANSKVPFGNDFVTDLTFNQVDYDAANLNIYWVKEYGGGTTGIAPISNYPEQYVDDIFIGLGDSDFYGTWQPFSEKYLAIVMQHEMGHVIGFGHDDEDPQTNPDNLMNSVAPGFEYGIVEQTFTLTGGYGQSIPAFTSRDVTNFNYHVSTDNEGGFNVYFAPDLDTAMDQWQSNQQIDSYPGCFVEDVMSTGALSCNNVEMGSGLFITIPLTSATEQTLTDITVKLQENFDGIQSLSNVATTQEAPIMTTAVQSSKIELLEISDVESEHESVFMDGADYLTVTDTTLTQDIDKFTITGWMKPDFSKSIQDLTIVSKFHSFDLYLQKEFLQVQGANSVVIKSRTLVFTLFDGAVWHTIPGQTKISEDWHHVAAIVDGSVATLYLDGKFEGKVKLEKKVPVNFSSEAGICQQKECIIDVKMLTSDADLVIGAYMAEVTKANQYCDDKHCHPATETEEILRFQDNFTGIISSVEIFGDAFTKKQVFGLYEQDKNYYQKSNAIDSVAIGSESPALSDSECLDLAKERGLEGQLQGTHTLVCQFPFNAIIPLNSSILWMETLPLDGGPYHIMVSVDDLFRTEFASFALMDFYEPDFPYGLYEYLDVLNESLTGKIIIAEQLEIKNRVSTIPIESKTLESIKIAMDSASPDCAITNSCYEPFASSVDVRAEVIWKNVDSFTHTVTSGTPEDGPDGIFDSGLLPNYRYFSHIFYEAGIYDYYCTLHPWMQGMIVVGEI